MIEPVLLIGAGGMLGRAFAELFAREAVAFRALDRRELELTDPASIEGRIGAGVRTVINCAAFTDVAGAESREGEARAVNGEAVGSLARRCADIGATLVHFSTDYVFDGRASQPYSTHAQRAPLNAYGRSKALGEELLEQSPVGHLMIRASWLYAPWGKNFVLTMCERLRTRDVVRVVSDQIGRPTSAEHLAERTLGLMRHGSRGTFHLTDEGQCSWFDLAGHLARRTGSRCRVEPCTSDEFPGPVRPAYSVLDLTDSDALLGPARSWQRNVDHVLAAAGLATTAARPV